MHKLIDFRSDKRFVRRARELETIYAMILMYCRHHHGASERLCAECTALGRYSERRLERRIFGDAKPTCSNCVVHCYRADMRERVREVMRWAGPRMLAFWRTRRWFRELFRAELQPYHALLFCEAVAWLFYRYIVVSRELAHTRTLFLELVFVAMFLGLFWAAAIVIARLAEMNFGRELGETFRRITVAALPIVVLPFLGAIWIKLPSPRTWMLVTLLLCVAGVADLIDVLEEDTAALRLQVRLKDHLEGYTGVYQRIAVEKANRDW